MFPIEDCLGGRPSHSPTANSLTSIRHEGITAMPSMKSPPDTVGQVGWPLSPHDLQMHVGFQQTPKRRGQQTMGRLLPACSAFTNPPSSCELELADRHITNVMHNQKALSISRRTETVLSSFPFVLTHFHPAPAGVATLPSDREQH